MTVSEGALHHYDAFGLVLESEFLLPELQERHLSKPHLGLDERVVIRGGDVGATLEDGRRLADWIQVNQDSCLYEFPEFCRILVSKGREVIVSIEPQASESDMRAFLFGSALGTIAHQRRMVPLHISAVESERGVLAFTGQSGAGKSTTVAALSKFSGMPIVCDDMACLLPGRDATHLYGGVKRNKLWVDAIAKLGLEDRTMHPDLSRSTKFHLEIAESGQQRFGPVTSFFQLDWADEVAITPLTPGKSFEAVMNAIYRPYLAPIFSDLAHVRSTIAQFVNATPCFRLTRPRSFDHLPKVADEIRAHIRAL